MNHAFFLQLLNAFGELFVLVQLQVAQHAKMLRLEGRDRRKLARRSCADGVADGEDAGIAQADYVAGEGFFDGFAFLGKEAVRAAHADGAPQTGMVDGHVLFKAA